MAAKSRKQHKNKKSLQRATKPLEAFKLAISGGSLSWRSPQMLRVKSNQILKAINSR
jgi:hypothetical protein